MDITAIVVTFNSADSIALCLSALRVGLGGRAHEILVVDNGSADGTTEVVEASTEQVRIIRNVTNEGFSAANNTALRLARGEFVLFVNPDCVLSSGAIDELLVFLKQQPRYVAAGPLLVSDSGAVRRVCARRLPRLLNQAWQLSHLDRAFPHSPVLAHAYYQPFDYRDSMDVEGLSGAAMLCRRSAVVRVGGFDEAVPLYLDDIDLCKRLGTVGKLRFVASAVARHSHNASGSKHRQGLVERLSLQARYRYLLKHHRFEAGGFVALAGLTGLMAAVIGGCLYGIGQREWGVRALKRGMANIGWCVSDKTRHVRLPRLASSGPIEDVFVEVPVA